MMFSVKELDKLLEAGDMSPVNQVKFNILNFIHTIHLNGQDFVKSYYASEFYGELPMTFRKDPGQLFGLATAVLDGGVKMYVFNKQGFECLEDLVGLAGDNRGL